MGHLEFVTKYDGKDSPCTGGPVVDTCSARKVDAYTMEGIQKKSGKVIWKAIISVSKNVKTLTFGKQRKDPAGQEVSTITVYDRQ
jgi:hypothetical protein